jgi:hypothetical protein
MPTAMSVMEVAMSAAKAMMVDLRLKSVANVAQSTAPIRSHSASEHHVVLLLLVLPEPLGFRLQAP